MNPDNHINVNKMLEILQSLEKKSSKSNLGHFYSFSFFADGLIELLLYVDSIDAPETPKKFLSLESFKQYLNDFSK